MCLDSKINIIITTISIIISSCRQNTIVWPLSFSSTLQLINGVSSDLQKLLKYFNGTAIVTFFSIPLAALSAWTTVFSSCVS